VTAVRLHLEAMTDYRLRDIGLTRLDIEDLAKDPFRTSHSLGSIE
jgi:uncharacterized protein YjiS (DUF1127 family)